MTQECAESLRGMDVCALGLGVSLLVELEDHMNKSTGPSEEATHARANSLQVPGQDCLSCRVKRNSMFVLFDVNANCIFIIKLIN